MLLGDIKIFYDPQNTWNKDVSQKKDLFYMVFIPNF